MVSIPRLTERQAWHLHELNGVLWILIIAPLIGMGSFLALMTYLPLLGMISMVAISSLFVGLVVSGFIQIYVGYQEREMEMRNWREEE